MKIRDYAKEVGFEIVGKLTRHPELEYDCDDCRHYVDEADNEYIVGKNGVCIVTADGDVI